MECGWSLDLLLMMSSHRCPKLFMIKDRADYGMVREGRKVTGLGLKASVFNDIDLQPGTLRNSGILNLTL